MELVEIDETTEETFYRCLHDERPADPRVMEMRRTWRAEYAPKGHRAKVLKDDTGQVVGLTNYIPVEHSPYEGEPTGDHLGAASTADRARGDQRVAKALMRSGLRLVETRRQPTQVATTARPTVRPIQ